MPTRPSTIPTWATDAAYPAGSDAWSATPTVVTPSGGAQAAGHVPNIKPPAQHENWFKNLVSKWVDYLDDRMTGLLGATRSTKALVVDGTGDNVVAGTAGYVTFTASAPANTTAVGKSVTARNLVRGWAQIAVNGIDQIETVAMDWFNITNFDVQTSGNLRVTFATAMSNSNYSVIATPSHVNAASPMVATTSSGYAVCAAKTTTYFELRFYDSSWTPLDLHTVGYVLAFDVMVLGL